MFDDCTFINSGSKVGGGASMTYAFSVATDANGLVLLNHSTIAGADDVANDPGNIWSNETIATNKEAGKMIVVIK
jgi:hypothetical protein